MYEHQVLPPYPYIRFTRARGSAQGRTIIDWLVPKKSWKDPLLPTTVITRGISRKSRLIVYDNQSADILDNKGSVPKDRSLSVIIRVAPSNSSINRYFDFFFNEALINLARIF